MNAAKLALTPQVKMLVTGYPGAGKTGSLASLANAGFKLRVIDFDGNPESLIQYTRPEYLSNIDIVSVEDKYVDKGMFTGPEGMPMAYTRAMKLLDRWRYEDPDGSDIDAKTGKRFTDLGSPSSWGPDTILVCDGTTGLSEAALWRARALAGKTPLTMTQAVWGTAANEMLNFTKRFVATGGNHHSIMIGHLKIVGPKVEQSGDTDLTKAVKAEAADLIPTKLQPTAVGWNLPQYYAGEFTNAVHIGQEVKGKTVLRRIHYKPRTDMDLKLPVKGELADLSIRDGMLRIFQALGVPMPSTCVPTSAKEPATND